MNLQKAIEILGDILHTTCLDRRTDENHAVKLGIEALKREHQRRKYLVNSTGEMLPGETL